GRSREGGPVHVRPIVEVCRRIVRRRRALDVGVTVYAVEPGTADSREVRAWPHGDTGLGCTGRRTFRPAGGNAVVAIDEGRATDGDRTTQCQSAQKAHRRIYNA